VHRLGRADQRTGTTSSRKHEKVFVQWSTECRRGLNAPLWPDEEVCHRGVQRVVCDVFVLVVLSPGLGLDCRHTPWLPHRVIGVLGVLEPGQDRASTLPHVRTSAACKSKVSRSQQGSTVPCSQWQRVTSDITRSRQDSKHNTSRHHAPYDTTRHHTTPYATHYTALPSNTRSA
jgi:hypothetical protein